MDLFPFAVLTVYAQWGSRSIHETEVQCLRSGAPLGSEQTAAFRRTEGQSQGMNRPHAVGSCSERRLHDGVTARRDEPLPCGGVRLGLEREP